MKTTLFLDFDGVLHPDAVYSGRNKPLELRAPGALFMHAHILEETLGYHPEVSIVLSTSWVRFLGYERTLSKMPQKLRERVTGATWHKHMRHGSYDPFNDMTRFQQIHSHVNRNRVDHWLVLDDLHSGTEDWPEAYRDHLILTEESKGLSCDETQAELNTRLMNLTYKPLTFGG